MTCRRKVFCEYIAALLEVGAFEDSCLNGLQVQGNDEIKKIATAVSPTLHVIRQAKEYKADALITHHGLFLKGETVPITGTLREKLHLLLASGISLLAYHLPLDAHRTLGNNWAVARSLGWQDLQPFGAYKGVYFGVRGTMPPCTIAELAGTLERFYGQPPRVALGGPKSVTTCAILSGGAHKWIDEAADVPVDCFVTGTADEPTWPIAFERGIHLLAYGHAATEKIGVKLLGEQLATHFHLEQHFIDEPNPF